MRESHDRFDEAAGHNAVAATGRRRDMGVTSWRWLMNIAAGPATGTLLAITALVGYPGCRGLRAQLVACSLYVASALFAGSIVGGLFPWPYADRRGLGVLFVGVHDEGLLGIGGVVLGGLVAAAAPRRKDRPTKPLS